VRPGPNGAPAVSGSLGRSVGRDSGPIEPGATRGCCGVAVGATSVGGAGTEDVKPDSFLKYQNKLIARTKEDPRLSSNSANNATTNILVTNIRDASDTLIYKETAGARSGKGTIYEVATVEPFTGPFGYTEYYKMLWRRAENQTVGD
jgi:hypothetical protein